MVRCGIFINNKLYNTTVRIKSTKIVNRNQLIFLENAIANKMFYVRQLVGQAYRDDVLPSVCTHSVMCSVPICKINSRFLISYTSRVAII